MRRLHVFYGKVRKIVQCFQRGVGGLREQVHLHAHRQLLQKVFDAQITAKAFDKLQVGERTLDSRRRSFDHFSVSLTNDCVNFAEFLS